MEKKVKVTIELGDNTLWYLFNEAHRRDITLNQLVNDMLREYIKDMEKKRAKRDTDRVRRRPRVGKD